LTFRLALASGAYAVMNGRETVAAYTPDGKPWLVMGTAIDSSDTIYLQRELLRNVLHDATTQLPNRLLFQERLDIALRPRKSAGAHPPAVLLLDIDRFQMVNEGFGHDMGDQMLARMARRLEECIAEDDLLARFGGDEFAILMENRPQPADALTIAERIVQAVRAPFEIGGSMLHASVRIGIAVGGGDKRATELVHEAEVALSGAKRPHSTGVEVFERRMFSRAAGHLHLDAELRRALARGELRLLYQPICSLHDGAIRGFEALLRWKHPRRGLIAPGEFLENAGLTGFIVPIGYYVLEEACKQLAEWGAINPSVSLSVNVDGRQFSMPDLALRIASLIARHGADPNQLKLELTETVIMQHDEIVAGQLDALRQLGVGILLDDFGTGFSSLGRLRQLPIDTLKIDRSFVQGAESNDDDAEIVRTILGLARTLGMTTVAEGIESHGQAQLMESQGCDLGQGYYFHRPLPAEDATRLLMQRTV
jgi:diguanylate cyclase (GGDEF)-like protein